MDNMIITQTFTMARWQIVVNRSEATKQTKDQTTTKQQNLKQNNTNKQSNKKAKNNNNNKNGRMGAEGYKANNKLNVILNIDLRETQREGQG